MTLRFWIVSLLCLAAGAVVAGARPSAQAERVSATFALGFGRMPTAAELTEWSQSESATVADLLSRARQQLQADASEAAAVAQRAAQDAFGSTQTSGGNAPGATLYAERVQQHVRRLAEHADEYRAVIDRAYQAVLNRAPYDVEYDYWKKQPTFSYLALAGAIENWARRNAPGLMATTGTPTVSITSEFLATVRLSPAIATEARLALGILPPATGDQLAALADRVAATGRTVVTPGATDLVSIGHIHLAICGRPGVVRPAGAR